MLPKLSRSLIATALQNANTLGIARLVNGEMSKAALLILKEFIQEMNSFLVQSVQRNRTLFK